MAPHFTSRWREKLLTMKVLWLNHKDPLSPRAGGAERTILEVGSRLARHGHSVTVLAGSGPGAGGRQEINGLMIQRYPSSLLPHVIFPLQLHFGPRPDVVIDDLAHVVPWGSPFFTDAPGVAFFRHLHARTLDGQVPWPASSILKEVESWYPRLYADWTFVTESKTGMEDLVCLGVPRGQLRQICPGVNREIFYPGPKTSRPSMIYFAGLRPYKNAVDAVRLLRELVHRGVQASLTIVGYGPSLPEVRREVQRWKLTNAVKFVGRVSDEQLAGMLRASWLNVQVSRAEGWGYTSLEAAASGVPTVAYRVPGVSEAVIEGTTGHLIEFGDLKGLTDMAMDLLSTVGTWQSRCRDYAETCDWEATTDLWEELLSGLVREAV